MPDFSGVLNSLGWGYRYLRPPLTLHEFYNSSHSLKSGKFLLFYKACLPFLYSMIDWHFPFIFIYLPLPQYVSAGARKQIQKIRNYAAILARINSMIELKKNSRITEKTWKMDTKKQPGISFPDCSDCRQSPAKAGFLLLLRPFF